jgi:hypothetical protein
LIVVSGALVVVSIVLLVLGLVDEDSLNLVYASIGTSIVAAVLLVLGALQRRGETPGVAADPFATRAEGDNVTAVTVTRPEPTETATSEAPAAATDAGSGGVLVVPGRPRYHVEGCRFLSGRSDVESLSVESAKGQDYTPCGVCRPDQALEEAAGTADTTETEADELAPRRTAASTRGRATTSTSRARTTAAKSTPAKSTAAKSTAAKSTAAKATAAKATRGAAAKAAPAKAAPAKAAPAKAAKATAATSTVVVIPDRDKFHTSECRFVRDASGTVSISKAAARREGYAACGVCKP